MLQKHITGTIKNTKSEETKNSLKSGTGKADFTSMIEDLGLFKANSDKPFFIQVMVFNF